ncbi:MAG: polysaccharide export protein [Deltaproteobacteria bacterium]|nr:polysaccharide export protein [Candidatus Anaeroferrophillacea bacterium]
MRWTPRRFALPLLLICLAIFSAPAAAATAGTTESSYLISPGDVLEISVWKDETLSRQVVVPPDGVISFPLINDINVNRMTVTALRGEVAARLKEFIPDPTVTVMLLQINSLTASVIGKVNQPGQYPITADATVMHLLARAGGLNPFADSKGIYILRRADGAQQAIPFNYAEVEDGRNLAQNIVLRRGDVVVVP